MMLKMRQKIPMNALFISDLCMRSMTFLGGWEDAIQILLWYNAGEII